MDEKIGILTNQRVEMRLDQHFASILGLECQLCKTNVDASTRTVGLDASNPAGNGLNYPYRGLK